MKFVLVFLAVLPIVMSAKIDDKRFLEQLLGGVDVVDLAKQLLCTFGTDETEQQCEDVLCPQLLESISLDGTLLESLLCGAVCKEAQVLANEFACSR